MKNVGFELTFLVQILKFKIPHVNTYVVIFIYTQFFYCDLLEILPERSQTIDPDIQKGFIEVFSKILLLLD